MKKIWIRGLIFDQFSKLFTLELESNSILWIILWSILQCARLEDQRSFLPGGPEEVDLEDVTVAVDGAAASGSLPNKAPTVPDEDFFSLILRLQSGRMEDQRAAVPTNPSRYQHPPLSEKTLNAKTNNSGARKEKKWYLTKHLSLSRD